MRIAATTVVVLLLFHSAYASDWYKGAYCDPALGGCSIHHCELSDMSPAQIYENNLAYGNAQIVDQDGNRVDVIAQGTRLIFFRTLDGCKKYVDQQMRGIQQREQEQQDKLNKYR